MIAFRASRLYTPVQQVAHPILLVERGLIAEIRAQSTTAVPPNTQTVDLGDAILVPGYVDLHIHGAVGHDVMSADAAGLAAVEHFLATHGTTTYYPTTVTAPLDETLKALERLATAIEDARSRVPSGRARPAGIHLEGPFLSHACRGVHPQKDLLTPSLQIFDRMWEAAQGQVRFLTIAPELPGALEVIAEASRRGVCVSLGHSDADLEATQAAVEAGARHATHTFNAMRPLHHRDPGIIGQVLTDNRLSADIIADGIHLSPAIVRLFLDCKKADSAVLISDATAATGMPDGLYRLGTLEVEVKGGRCLVDGKLAGSVLTLDRAVRNVMIFADWDLEQAVRLATLNPAQVAGLPDRGTLQPGAAADFVALDAEGMVRNVYVGGVPV